MQLLWWWKRFLAFAEINKMKNKIIMIKGLVIVLRFFSFSYSLAVGELFLNVIHDDNVYSYEIFSRRWRKMKSFVKVELFATKRKKLKREGEREIWMNECGLFVGFFIWNCAALKHKCGLFTPSRKFIYNLYRKLFSSLYLSFFLFYQWFGELFKFNTLSKI